MCSTSKKSGQDWAEGEAGPAGTEAGLAWAVRYPGKEGCPLFYPHWIWAALRGGADHLGVSHFP